MGVLLVFEERTVPVVPGAEATTTIRVRNNGTLVDELGIAVLGDASTWSTAEPATVSLLPGAEETIRLHFRPPRSPRVPAGPMPFAVHVSSKEDPEGSVAEEGVLEIAPYTDTSAEIVPRTSRGRRTGRHDLAVDNRGNVSLDAAIEGIDQEKKLAFEIQPPNVLAAAGTAAFAKVAVRPIKRFWRGPPQTHQFRLQVATPGQAPVTAEGTILQEAILPPWLMRALLLLLVGLIALALIWFLYLRPSIDAFVAQNVDDKVKAAVPAEVQKQVDARVPPAPTSGPVPTSAPVPTTAPVPSTEPVPSDAPAATAVSRDDRLIVDQDVARPEDEKTLFVTDLVFSNGEPDLTQDGVLQLLRGNKVLLQLRLADFRDLDFHFVTPITIGSGQQMRLHCLKGTCTDASVYYSGYER